MLPIMQCHLAQARSSSAPIVTELAANAGSIQEVFGGSPTLEQVYARLDVRHDAWAVATKKQLARCVGIQCSSTPAVVQGFTAESARDMGTAPTGRQGGVVARVLGDGGAYCAAHARAPE